MRSVLTISLVALLASCGLASEFNAKNVVTLNSKNFDEKVNDGSVWFVKFYAPWCGHCKRLAPDWGKLGDAMTHLPKVNVAHVDCTVDKEVCSKFEVRGYPTLKVLVNGAEYKSYRGGRDLNSLKSYLEETAKEVMSETVA